MNEKEDSSIRAVLLQGSQTSLVVFQVLLHVTRLDLEDVYHDADMLEYSRLLDGEVGIHEGILTTAIPEIQNEVAKKANVVLLDVDSSAKT